MNTSGVDLKCGHEGFPESSVCFWPLLSMYVWQIHFYQKLHSDIWNSFKELITHKSKSKFCNICVTFGAGAKTSGRGEWLNVDEQKSGWFEKNAAAVKNPDCEKWREFPWAPPSHCGPSPGIPYMYCVIHYGVLWYHGMTSPRHCALSFCITWLVYYGVRSYCRV